MHYRIIIDFNSMEEAEAYRTYDDVRYKGMTNIQPNFRSALMIVHKVKLEKDLVEKTTLVKADSRH